MTGERQYLLDKPRNVRRILWALYTLCAGTLLLDFLLHRHITHSWESMPGFYPLYGFVGCVTLVLVARAMRRVIIRPEDYYRRRDLPQHPTGTGEEDPR